MGRRFRRYAAAVAVSLATMVAAVGIAPAPASAGSLGFALTRDQTMNKGDYIERYTSDGIVRLVMQNDGNLVLYLVGVKACWGSNTVGTGHHAIYQRDGNFVVRNASGDPLWDSKTTGRNGETVDMDTNGRLWVGYTIVTGYCRI